MGSLGSFRREATTRHEWFGPWKSTPRPFLLRGVMQDSCL